jgi:hypothetical protein
LKSLVIVCLAVADKNWMTNLHQNEQFASCSFKWTSTVRIACLYQQLYEIKYCNLSVNWKKYIVYYKVFEYLNFHKANDIHEKVNCDWIHGDVISLENFY